jgi:hypothetical protein
MALNMFSQATLNSPIIVGHRNILEPMLNFY